MMWAPSLVIYVLVHLVNLDTQVLRIQIRYVTSLVVLCTREGIQDPDDLARFVVDDLLELLVIQDGNGEASTVVWIYGMVDFLDILEAIHWVNLIGPISS